MHRGLIISTIQTVFSILFYFVTMSIYNGMLNLGYSTIFTNLPIFCLIFDEDVDEKTALEYPPLYETLQKNRDLNLKTFLGWCLKSLYQGSIILILGIYMYSGDYFVNMVTITFTCLILTEFLNVYSEVTILFIIE
jgi:phospholipid-translocating ATPase